MDYKIILMVRKPILCSIIYSKLLTMDYKIILMIRKPILCSIIYSKLLTMDYKMILKDKKADFIKNNTVRALVHG